MRLQSKELLRQYYGMLVELRCCSGKTSKSASWQSEQSYGHRPELECSLMDSLTLFGVSWLEYFPLKTVWSLSRM